MLTAEGEKPVKYGWEWFELKKKFRGLQKAAVAQADHAEQHFLHELEFLNWHKQRMDLTRIIIILKNLKKKTKPKTAKWNTSNIFTSKVGGSYLLHVCPRGSALELFLEVLTPPLCLEQLLLELQELFPGHRGTALLLGALATHPPGLEHLRKENSTFQPLPPSARGASRLQLALRFMVCKPGLCDTRWTGNFFPIKKTKMEFHTKEAGLWFIVSGLNFWWIPIKV